MLETIDRHWGLVLLASGALGGIGTLALLRLRAHRVARSLAEAVRSGRLLWACIAREKYGGLYGERGTLTVSPDGTLTFTPDARSEARSRHAGAWPAGTFTATMGRRRWDISGLRLSVLTVQPAHGPQRRFACGLAAGDQRTAATSVSWRNPNHS